MKKSRHRFVFAVAILREMFPTLILASSVSTFLLLIQVLFKLADLIVSRRVPISTAFSLMFLAVPYILEMTVPIGTLFAILITVSRMGTDSELIALQSSGVSLRRILRPVIIMAAILFCFDGLLAWFVVPWTNRQFSHVQQKLIFSTAVASITARTFTEDFPGKLLFVNNTDPDTNKWRGVLLVDMSNSLEERFVIADSGQLVADPRDGTAWLKLDDTTTHVLRPDQPDKYQTVENTRQDIHLNPLPTLEPNQKVIYGVRESEARNLLERLAEPSIRPQDRNEIMVELQKRIAIPAACIAFALIGFPLAIRNRRGGKGYGLTVSVALIVIYYVLLINGERLALDGTVPFFVGVWLANLVLMTLGLYLFRQTTRLGSKPSITDFGLIKDVVRFFARLSRGKDSAGYPQGKSSDEYPITIQPRGETLPWRLGVLDRYVLSRCLSFFLLVLIAVFAISITVDLSEKLSDIQRHSVTLGVIFRYYFFSMPQILNDKLPIAFLIAFLGTAAMLERNNETVALKASGISLTRISMPLLLLSGCLAATLFMVNDQITQRMNRASQRYFDIIKDRRVARSYNTALRPWMFLPDGRTLVNFLEYKPDTDTIVQPSVYVFDERFNLRARYMAAKAKIVDGHWRAEDAWSRTFIAGQPPEFVSYKRPIDLPLPVGRDYFSREVHKPSQMSFFELRQYIDTLSVAGYKVDRWRVEFHQKLAYPLSLVVLTWLALPYAFRAGRRGTMVGISVALVLGMAYFAILALFTRLGEVSLLSPALASWTPTVIFALLAANRHTTLRT